MTAIVKLAAGAATALMILAGSLFGSPAQAQMPGQQVSLTPDIVERLIDSVPAVQATAEGLQAKYDVNDGGFGDDPVRAWQVWLAYGDARSALGQTCQQYGFADFNDWLATFSSVAMAHAFARKGGEMDDQMAQAVEFDPQQPEHERRAEGGDAEADRGLHGRARCDAPAAGEHRCRRALWRPPAGAVRGRLRHCQRRKRPRGHHAPWAATAWCAHKPRAVTWRDRPVRTCGSGRVRKCAACGRCSSWCRRSTDRNRSTHQDRCTCTHPSASTSA